MKYKAFFWTIFVLFTAAFLMLVFNNNVWYDEAYSLAMIKHSFSEIAAITAKDVHPPLYYYGLKCFMKIMGGSLASAKIFSIIPICLTMIFGFKKLSYLYNEKTGLLFAVFFAAMPVFTIYSVQVRMYTWCIFFVFACGIYGYLAIKEDKLRYWVLLTLFAVLSAYTHYFALVSAGIIYACVIFASIKSGRFLKSVIFALAVVLLYLPWLSSFAAQLEDKVNNEYWISPITLETVGEYFKSWYKCGTYTTAYMIGSCAVYVIAAAGLISDGKMKKAPLFLGVLVFVLTCAVGIGASILVRPVFLERYANHALVFLAAFAAAGVAAFDKKGICAIIAAFYLLGFAANYKTDYDFEYGEQENEIGEYINGNDFDALICFSTSPLYGVLAYYSDTAPVYRPKVSAGSPFENIYPLSELDFDNCRKAALFVSDSAEIPPEIYQMFDGVEYERDVVSYWQKSNVYILSNND